MGAGASSGKLDEGSGKRLGALRRLSVSISGKRAKGIPPKKLVDGPQSAKRTTGVASTNESSLRVNSLGRQATRRRTSAAKVDIVSSPLVAEPAGKLAPNKSDPRRGSAPDVNPSKSGLVSPVFTAPPVRRFSTPGTKAEKAILAQKVQDRVYHNEANHALQAQLRENSARNDGVAGPEESGESKDGSAPKDDGESEVDIGWAKREAAVDEGLKHFLFQDLNKQAKSLFIRSLVEENFAAGEAVFDQGGEGNKLFIVESGVVQFFLLGKEEPLSTAGKGGVFGELAIIYGTQRSCGARAKENLVLWSLDRSTFRKIMAVLQVSQLEMTQSYVKNKIVKSPLDSSRVVTRVVEPAPPPKPDMEFSNLKALAVLGTGGFSMVTLVRNTKVPDTFFALKAVSKKQVYEGRMTEKIMVEKAALAAACTHPMCLQMIATFQDDNFLYLLTEVAEGGDLMKRMVAQDILPIDVALFYAGCITTAVAHMHEHHFVHRDIKPENVLIALDGYVKLADFGLSKVVPYDMRLADGTTRECDLCYTMCGTPEFLAPEYVLSKGYDKSADWWALGCVVYEMLFGENPFEADDLKQTFTRICNIGMGIKPLPISLSFEDNYPTTANFIVGLLTRQDKRLGNQGGGNAVQSHDFFNDLDWDCLIRKEIPPPFTPSAVKDRFAGVEGAVNFYPGKVPPIFDGPQEWCEPWCS